MSASHKVVSMLAVPSIRPSTTCAAKASVPACTRAIGSFVRNFSNSSSSSSSITPISTAYTTSIAAPTSSSVRSQLFSSPQVLQRQQQRQQQQQRRSMAKMAIIGRLTSAPEAIMTNNGRECVRYTIAKGHGKDKTPSFFRVMMFDEGEGKELLLGLTKGSLVYIEATAKLRTYTDDRDGVSKTSLGLIHKNLQILLRHKTFEEREQQEQQKQQDEKEQQGEYNNSLMMDQHGEEGGGGGGGGGGDTGFADAEGEVYDGAPVSSSGGR